MSHAADYTSRRGEKVRRISRTVKNAVAHKILEEHEEQLLAERSNLNAKTFCSDSISSSYDAIDYRAIESSNYLNGIFQD
jgi:hypothetical protein